MAPGTPRSSIPPNPWCPGAAAPKKMWIWVKFRRLPSGKRLHNYGKSPFLKGKLTFSIAMLNYQRVNYLLNDLRMVCCCDSVWPQPSLWLICGVVQWIALFNHQILGGGLGTNVHPAGRSKATAVRFPDHLANRFSADYSENGDESWQIHQQHQQVIAKHWSANLQQMCGPGKSRESTGRPSWSDAKIAKTYGFQLVFLKRSRKANPLKWFTSFVYPPFAPPRQHSTAQLLPWTTAQPQWAADWIFHNARANHSKFGIKNPQDTLTFFTVWKFIQAMLSSVNRCQLRWEG